MLLRHNFAKLKNSITFGFSEPGAKPFNKGNQINLQVSQKQPNGFGIEKKEILSDVNEMAPDLNQPKL